MTKQTNVGEKDFFDDLAKGFRKAADIVRMEKPDVILCPVAGSVPFVDILNILDRKFRLGAVEYVPNSSRFENREELMARWYESFYGSRDVGEQLKILCLDEVLSGASAVVGFRQFQKSLEERARKKAKGLTDESAAIEKYKRKLAKYISYKVLGLAERGYERNPEFSRLGNRGLAHVIEFDSIPTIDNVLMNPIRFKVGRVQENGKAIYLPEIERFDITPEYMELLRGIARYAGVDPSTVNPVNLSKIQEGLNRALKL